MKIPFGEWLPDWTPQVSGNPHVTIAKNCYAADGGYRPISSLSQYSDALGDRCQGAATFIDDAGDVYTYAGDSTAIYSLADASWSDISVTASVTMGSDDFWEFARWGNQVFFAGINNYPQQVTFGANSVADLHTEFKAAHIAVVKQFVMYGNTWDSTDGFKRNRLRWSRFNDPTQNTVGVSQADYQDLQGDGSDIQRIFGGEVGYIFQRRSISQARYVGTPLVFEIEEVEPDRGLVAPQAAAQLGRFIFYLSDDGFYVFNGVESTPIGTNKVDDYFGVNSDSNYKDRIVCAVDPVRSLVVWAYPTAGSAGVPDALLIYNWKEQKWSNAAVTTQYLFGDYTKGYTLEGLDSVSGSIDALSVSLDDPAWQGGNLAFSAFDGSNQLNYFSGAAMTAVIETAEYQAFPQRRSTLKSIRPHVERYNTIYHAVASRDFQDSTVSFSTLLSLQDSGVCKPRKTARYHRIRTQLEGGFTLANGLEVEHYPRGKR